MDEVTKDGAMAKAKRPIYDTIGIGYAELRRPDPRIQAAITAALGAATSVVNVGAGAGSYEPTDRLLVAVEPSPAMIRQRPPGSAPAVRGTATHLPIADGAFDAALAILTVHHWPDRVQGLRELARVARDRVVVVNHDLTGIDFWLVDEYFPEIRAIDSGIFPTAAEFEAALGPVQMRPIPVPFDCSDGFLGAYWRRPQAYLEPSVRQAISTFSRVSDVSAGVERLRADLADGSWERRHGALLRHDTLDLGYRLVVGRGLGA